MAALALGGGLGILNGVLTRISLSWAVRKSDRLFYGVWVAGVLYRLVFLAGLAALLWRRPFVPLLPALLALIAGQLALQLIPLRKPWT